MIRDVIQQPESNFIVEESSALHSYRFESKSRLPASDS